MEFSSDFKTQQQDIIELFTHTFTVSEGGEEGELIGDLARRQMAGTEADDLHVFSVRSGDEILGAAIFSRLSYDEDERSVFVLGPVAVAPEHQRQGIGYMLLKNSLRALREAGVDLVFTYGDPNYYTRVGFEPVSEGFAAAPFKLQYPEGWQGLSLTEDEMTPVQGECRCVAAFDDPRFW